MASKIDTTVVRTAKHLRNADLDIPTRSAVNSDAKRVIQIIADDVDVASYGPSLVASIQGTSWHAVNDAVLGVTHTCTYDTVGYSVDFFLGQEES